MATEQAAEAEKLRRVPGIYFFDESYGRVVRVKGTGLQVFEIIKTYRNLGESREHLRQAYDWLSEEQIQAAFDYLEAYPDEVEVRLAEEAQHTPEKLWERYPQTRPRPR
jgi:uncharacterized protein (DUF433 family)